MNNITFIIIAIVVAFSLWGSIQCRRQSRKVFAGSEISEEDRTIAKGWRYGANTLLIIAFAISVVFVTSLLGIPNLFAPEAPESAPPTSGLVIDSSGPIVVIPTNANPSAAAEDNRQLLEKAKRQQQEDLKQ